MEETHAENSTVEDALMSDPLKNSPGMKSPVITPSPLSNIHHRPGYQRVPTFQEQDFPYIGNESAATDRHEGGNGWNSKSRSLRLPSRGSPAESPISDRSSPSNLGSASFLLSPSMTSHDYHLSTPSADPFVHQSHGGNDRNSSYKSTDNLLGTKLDVREPTSTGPENENGGLVCKATRGIHHAPGPSFIILLASLWSTTFSGLWLYLAVNKQHYGRLITNNGRLPPSMASSLFSACAKTIEMTFITVVVALIGQLLSQRALKRSPIGITISEMQMRTWIVQPGTLFTHFTMVRYAALTFLGIFAVIATLLAMVYTTASNALVTPQLQLRDLQHRVLYGQVGTRFANVSSTEDQCSTPIFNTDGSEGVTGKQTCLAIQMSGQAYHDYTQYLTEFTTAVTTGRVSTTMNSRTPPLGLMYDNTTVKGSWINEHDMTELSLKYGRIVNNVTMAMPHSAVFAAARDPRNDILQPQDASGLGEYFIRASVPSPSLNVLCANMTEDELAPIVFSKWPGVNSKLVNATSWPTEFLSMIPTVSSSEWLNTTVVDDLFGFGRKYGRRPPLFSLLPEPFNTVINFTSWPVYSDSFYVLTAAPSSNLSIPSSTYMLCSMRAFLSPNCSTRHHATRIGDSLNATCEDRFDNLAYIESAPDATSGVYSNDWIDIATQLGDTLSLNTGISNDQASNARLLSQFIPTEPRLNASRPSIAEALAVLAGNTLLLSGLNAPFIHFWNYTDNWLENPVYEAFNATIRMQDYASGGGQHLKYVFFVVLAAVFLANVFCFVYFVRKTDIVTDFMEPQNLFTLSLNSPPSQDVEGACGGGPQGEQLRTRWNIEEDLRGHFFIRPSLTLAAKEGLGHDIELTGSPGPHVVVHQ